jgi:galactose oxidase
MCDAVAGKILTVGGAPSYQDDSDTSNAHVITISAPWAKPQVTTINSMWYTRAYANGVALPDNKVLILGGQTYAKPFTDTNAILTPEL